MMTRSSTNSRRGAICAYNHPSPTEELLRFEQKIKLNKPGQLVTLKGLPGRRHEGKLAVIVSYTDEITGGYLVDLRGEISAPFTVQKENMAPTCHRCNRAGDTRIILCQECLVAVYCNGDCLREDIHRHGKIECAKFGSQVPK